MRSREPAARALSLRRWREYVVACYPGLRRNKSRSDLCDRCVRIDIELASLDITNERREELLKEKAVHLEEAIKQRRV